MKVEIPTWLQEKGDYVHLFVKSNCGAQKVCFTIGTTEVDCRTIKLDAITCYSGSYDTLTHSSWDIADSKGKKICHVCRTGECVSHDVHIIYPVGTAMSEIERNYFNVKRDYWEASTILYPIDLMINKPQNANIVALKGDAGKVIYVSRTVTKAEIKDLGPAGAVISALGSYQHYGVDIGDGTVVHFDGPGLLNCEEYRIKRTSMSEFLKGGNKMVDPFISYEFQREGVVERALSAVGRSFGTYDLLTNNCEHFANWCANGKRISCQSPGEDDRDIVERGIDMVFKPLKTAGDAIDRFFGWGDHKR